jgi:hypothetical protein
VVLFDHLDATSTQQHHVPGKTRIADHHVAAACQDEHRLPTRVGGSYGSHRFIRFGHDGQRAGRSAEA